jgi:hypothetical protein
MSFNDPDINKFVNIIKFSETLLSLFQDAATEIRLEATFFETSIAAVPFRSTPSNIKTVLVEFADIDFKVSLKCQILQKELTDCI